MRTEAEKAYTAGIVDGEGSIFIRFRLRERGRHGISHEFTTSISIANTNKDMLHWLQRIWNLDTKLLFRKGNEKNKDVWTLRVENKHAIRLMLNEILPYLIIKRKNAELLLDFINHREERLNVSSKLPVGQRFCGADNYELIAVEQMRGLNARGLKRWGHDKKEKDKP